MDKEYNLEIEKIIAEINKNKFKNILFQFPDGLKPQSKEIIKEIENKTNAHCMTWFGSCFGACDLPNINNIKIDLLIQFGHNEFIKDWRDI